LDFSSKINLTKFSFSDDWFRGFLSSKDFSLILLYHPELCFVKSQINEVFFITSLTSIIFSIFEETGVESFFTPMILLPQFLFLFFVGIIFINFYFNYFSSQTKEGNLIDADYLISNNSAEAEKEITSYDDIILGLVIIIYVFG